MKDHGLAGRDDDLAAGPDGALGAEARDDVPPSRSVLYELAVRAADEASYAGVAELFREARARDEIGERGLQWRRLLLEAGHLDLASELLPPSHPVPGAGQAEERPPSSPPDGDLLEDAAEADFLDFEAGERAVTRPAIPPQRLALFRRFFAGRGDVYARQWFDARRERGGYWPVREPLSDAVIQEHLLGRLTVGQYVLHPDETVDFAVIDLDPTPEAQERERLEGGGAEPRLAGPLPSFASRLVATARDAGLDLAVEDTGGLGLHLWIWFAPRAPASEARALLRELLRRAGAPPPSVSVEVFPKQDRLSGKGLGNLVKLPLGIHQATMRRSHMLDGSLRPLDDDAALAGIAPSSPLAVRSLLSSKVVPLVPSSAAGPAAAPPEETSRASVRLEPAARALAEALAAIPAGREADAAADRILASCAVVRDLSRRAFEEAQLAPDAARVLLYTIGLVGRSNSRIEQALRAAGVSAKELDRVRRGIQGPMGCRRIGQMFPELAGRCACPPPPPGGYATPALLAFAEPPALQRSRPPWALADGLLDVPAPAPQHEIERRLSRIEEALQRIVERLP